VGGYFDYEDNSVLFTKGDDAHTMYFVVTGEIPFFSDKDRTAKKLVLLDQLAHFGEQGLLSINAEKRTASNHVLERARLIRVSGELINPLLRQQSKLVRQLEKICAE
jgi:CRP-like cAMP-binding protein